MKWSDEKAEMVAKADVVKTALEGKAIRCRLSRITRFGFGYIVETGQDLTEIMVGLFEKWEDVTSVFVSHQPDGRMLWVGFGDEGQPCG